MEANQARPISDISVGMRILAYLVILLGYFFYCYNFVVIDYVKPYLMKDYGWEFADTAYIYTYQSFGALVGAVATGIIAKKIGNKNTLIFYTILNGLATLACVKFTDAFTWNIMRLIIGISLGGYSAASVAIMVGLFPPQHRAKVTAIATATFSLALMFMGFINGYAGDAGWELIVYVGAIPPLVSAALQVFTTPSDKKYIPYGNSATIEKDAKPVEVGTWGEMLSPTFRKLTILVIVLAALNSYGYSFFSSFVTVYLKTVREFDAATMGALVAAQGAGGLFGAYICGIVSDMVGRRIFGAAFIACGVAICAYYLAPSDPTILGTFAFIYGFCLTATAIWGAYFTELFPQRLRPMGSSMFHASRILGMWAPVVLVFIKDHSDLQTAMWFSPGIFFVGGLIWLSLPETFKNSFLYKGYDPEEKLKEMQAARARA